MRRPLEGIRVADFSWVGAGPFVTKAMADHGAEVVKIESRARPDVLRDARPFAGGRPGVNRSGYFANRNPGKLSVTLDLRRPEGRDLALRLVARSDVVVDNFSPGVMERLGLGPDACRAVNPAVVCLSMPMQGATGPHAAFRGYGVTIAALSGLLDRIGYPDRPPRGTGTNFPDHAPNPLHGACAVMAALLHRKRGGGGQTIELSQLESTLNFLGPALLAAAAGEPAEPRAGTGAADRAPMGVYPCAGDDRWIVVDCETDGQWLALCAAIDRPDLADDPRLTTSEGRLAARATLDAAVSAWTAVRDRYEAMRRLQAAGVPAGVVQDARDTLENDPQLAHRGHWVRLDHAEMGRTVYDASPYRFSTLAGRPEAPAPCLGEHTHDVCRRILGLSAGEIAALEEAGVLN